MPSTWYTHPLASWTSPKVVLKGSRLAHGFREKSTWFVDNIVTIHPILVEPRVRTARFRKARKPPSERFDVVTVNVVQEEVDSSSHHRSSRPRSLRLSRRAKLSNEQATEDPEPDVEDYGQLRCVPNEDSTRSGFTQYYSAVSHSSGFNAVSEMNLSPLVDEDSGVAFTPIYPDDCSVVDPCAPDSEIVRLDNDPAHIQPPRSSGLLSAPTPSIVLTLPTPQISQSPIFQPRSPITLAKYVQATATSPRVGASVASASIGSLSPVPSVPSCDRCCLAQLEDGMICRSCERQWLACRMWYQANDGGRRRWLTEPLIRPAESNATVRNVMDVLGVPGSPATVGLGFEQLAVCKNQLPFKVISTPAHLPRWRCNCGECPWSALRWRHFRRNSLDAAGRARDTLSTWFSALFARVSHSSGNILHVSWKAPHNSLETPWTVRIAPNHPRQLLLSSPSHGSSPLCGLACGNPGSRFIEHLV